MPPHYSLALFSSFIYKQGYIRDVKLNSLNKRVMLCFKVAIVLAIKFSKSFVDVESASI